MLFSRLIPSQRAAATVGIRHPRPRRVSLCNRVWRRSTGIIRFIYDGRSGQLKPFFSTACSKRQVARAGSRCLKAEIMRMTELNRAYLDKHVRGVGVRQIRLACGLVLFAYLLSHFINHALGNISMDALATGVRYHTAFWRSLPVATVFYAAASAHAGLGIWALYQRRQFHWKAIEPIQLVLGLSIPALIITHLAGVRIDDVLFQHQKLYPQVFYSYWMVWPYKMWLMFN